MQQLTNFKKNQNNMMNNYQGTCPMCGGNGGAHRSLCSAASVNSIANGV